MLSRTGNFKNAKQGNAEKATRALYEVLKLGRLHNLSIKCQLDLFGTMVKPVLLYGCEIWGMGSNDILERVHLKFCKLLLNLKTSTPSYMIYGELRRYTICIEIDVKRIISFWTNLCCGKESKSSAFMAQIVFLNVSCG